ncbi:UNVERIFIED_CONTAM: hypothetical protein K2H54_034779 [Gekko kuhli]
MTAVSSPLSYPAAPLQYQSGQPHYPTSTPKEKKAKALKQSSSLKPNQITTCQLLGVPSPKADWQKLRLAFLCDHSHHTEQAPPAARCHLWKLSGSALRQSL